MRLAPATIRKLASQDHTGRNYNPSLCACEIQHHTEIGHWWLTHLSATGWFFLLQSVLGTMCMACVVKAHHSLAQSRLAGVEATATCRSKPTKYERPQAAMWQDNNLGSIYEPWWTTLVLERAEQRVSENSCGDQNCHIKLDHMDSRLEVIWHPIAGRAFLSVWKPHSSRLSALPFSCWWSPGHPMIWRTACQAFLSGQGRLIQETVNQCL